MQPISTWKSDTKEIVELPKLDVFPKKRTKLDLVFIYLLCPGKDKVWYSKRYKAVSQNYKTGTQTHNK